MSMFWSVLPIDDAECPFATMRLARALRCCRSVAMRIARALHCDLPERYAVRFAWRFN